MFKVSANNYTEVFYTLEEAKAYAEKTSWLNAVPVYIETPEGKRLKIAVGAGV